jgi:hypothetical protein
MLVEQKTIELRDPHSLIPYEKNAKKHGKEQVSKIAASIRKFGWRGNPIVVDKNGVIIAGHGRRLAAIELGLPKVPVQVVDDLSEDEVRALRLADNRAAISDYDNEMLKEELIDLDFDLSDIFDKKELDFAVADLMAIDDTVFESDLENVMTEQAHATNEKVTESEEKRVPIQKLLGFKDIQGKDAVYITRFMAQLEAESGAKGEAAFMGFIKSLIGEIKS